MGDGIQAAKAGILEIGDVFVVNKADRDGADATVRDLRAHDLARRPAPSPALWRPPVVQDRRRARAGDRRGHGGARQARAWLEANGELDRRGSVGRPTRSRRSRVASLRARFGDVARARRRWTRSPRQVVDGETDPYAAADRLVDHLDV